MSVMQSPASIGSVGTSQIPSSTTSFRHAQWRMLLAAMFCYLFFYTGRQTFGFAIPGIQAEFGVSKAALGWASAALLWCYAIGQAINGNLGDKFGGRRVMSAGAILSFIMNWATSLSTGIVSLSVFWGINGYFQSMGWAPGSRLLSNWWGRHERGTVYGLYTFAAGLASVLSFVTSLVVVGYFQLDWRWIFRIPVLLLLIGGIAFYLIARERPEDMGFASPHDDVVDDGTDIGSCRFRRLALPGTRRCCRTGGSWSPAFRSDFRMPPDTGSWYGCPCISSAPTGPRRMRQRRSIPDGSALHCRSAWRLAHLPTAGSRTSSSTHAATSAIVLYMVLAAITALYMYTIPTTAVYQGHGVFVPVRLLRLRPAIVVLGAVSRSGRPQAGGTATGVMNFCAYLFAGWASRSSGISWMANTSVVFLSSRRVPLPAQPSQALFVVNIQMEKWRGVRRVCAEPLILKISSRISFKISASL